MVVLAIGGLMIKFDQNNNLVIQSLSFIPPAIIPAKDVQDIYVAVQNGKHYPDCTPKYKLTLEQVEFIKNNFHEVSTN